MQKTPSIRIGSSKTTNPGEEAYRHCDFSDIINWFDRLKVGSSQAVVTVYKEKRSPTAIGENVTAIECIAADGFIMDPFFILKGDHHLERWYERADDNYWFATSKNGWTTDEIAFNWILLFHCATYYRVSVSKAEKRLLLFDNHGSHLTREWLEFCDEHGILCFPFPPHTTDILQPLDGNLYS
ncbi:uncharacterized protein N7473_013201 [Penicillium subrubescens]|uniref:uncharacterized protein n=1 Tax=Penicillium subrubescens TaxID=1316194 RepID=UPI00254595A2|nr:uncharacterized protein N7473_013201 [Penicillium subrubescens]KAJ5873642.1 hypothetical protein N7473_013201 [Penicillium subrubescens]